MRRRSILATLVLILALALPTAVVAADPPGPTTRHLYRVDSLPLAGFAEMVKLVQEFAPGAASPPHTHPGLTIVTMLEGELTIQAQGAEKVYKVGEHFTEVPGVVYTAINTGAVRSRAMVSIVLPKGAAPSTPQPGGPSPAPTPPTTLYLFRTDAFFPGEPYEVAQAVLDFGPGAQTPVHTHPGQVFVTVLEGELTVRMGGMDHAYKVGESFIEPPEVAMQALNAGTGRATAMVTYLLPKGAPLSTPVTMPGVPNTGGGGMARRAPAPLAALLLGSLLLALGLERRRRRA